MHANYTKTLLQVIDKVKSCLKRKKKILTKVFIRKKLLLENRKEGRLLSLDRKSIS